MADTERWQRLAAVILDAAREGFAVPEEAITWALQVTGDQPGSGMATAELWAFLLALEAGR
jgi:hypothetical protein